MPNKVYLAACVFPLLILLFSGCSAETYAGRADRSANKILDTLTKETLGDRQDTVIYPEKKKDVPPEGEAPVEAKEEGMTGDKPLILSLEDSLKMAFKGNRGYISQKESLFLSALSLVGTRHTFSPQLSSVLSYLLNDSTGSARGQDTDLSLSISQRLSHGGTLSLSGSTDYNASSDTTLNNPRTFSSSLGISLSQPLLRNAGKTIALESLIQGERNVVYAIREFELARQQFTIDATSRYYGLVGQQKQLENRRRSLDDATFTWKKAEAFFKIGEQSEMDVMRAKRNVLNSKNDLLAAEEIFELDLDRFKVFLGLPIALEIDITQTTFDFIDVDYDIESAVDTAMANRLDFLTRLEQLEDSERALAISKDGLLPDIDLNLGYNLSSNPNASFSNQKLENGSYSAGLTFGIPLDRVSQQNSYRQAQISHYRSVRSFEEYKDNFIINIRGAFRELTRFKKSLEITEQIIEFEKRNKKVSEIKFNQGKISNLDLVDAQQALLDAENNLVQDKITYEITRLGLLKDLGILFIDENGMWRK